MIQQQREGGTRAPSECRAAGAAGAARRRSLAAHQLRAVAGLAAGDRPQRREAAAGVAYALQEGAAARRDNRPGLLRRDKQHLREAAATHRPAQPEREAAGGAAPE